ncbi:MAG: extracellular solute-binding protein [Clostridiaceae bacterium]|nr:extracellular solute-binding protein [Clostridiaceae bacterium]
MSLRHPCRRLGKFKAAFELRYGKNMFPKIMDLYHFPTLNMISYRKDLFDKAGIANIPRTWEELYEVMMVLKDAYPESYPTYFPLVADIINTWSYMFGTGPTVYLNEKTGKWTCGPIEENSKKMIKWLAQCYKDKLTTQDFIKPDAQKQSRQKLGVEEPISILFENTWASAYKTTAIERGAPSDFEYQYMDPLTWENGEGGKLTMWCPVIGSGWAVSLNSKKKDAAFKLFDFLYSQEGTAWASFGPADLGITTSVKSENGVPPKPGEPFWLSPKWLDPSIPFTENVYNATGFLQIFPACRWQDNTDIDAYPEVYAITKKMLDANKSYSYFELPSSALTTEQFERFNAVFTNANDTAMVFFEKCIIGSANVDEGWDKFVSDMKKFGIDEILKMLDEASSKLAK